MTKALLQDPLTETDPVSAVAEEVAVPPEQLKQPLAWEAQTEHAVPDVASP